MQANEEADASNCTIGATLKLELNFNRPTCKVRSVQKLRLPRHKAATSIAPSLGLSKVTATYSFPSFRQISHTIYRYLFANVNGELHCKSQAPCQRRQLRRTMVDADGPRVLEVQRVNHSKIRLISLS